MTVNASKSEKFRLYREHLNRQIVLLSDKYNLSPLSGAEKQVAWATDIRIRFVEALDKHRDDLSDSAFRKITSQILSQTESRWWIDRREQTYEEYVSFAKTISLIDESEDSLPRYEKPSDVVFIDAETECVSVSYYEPDAITRIMQRHSFVRDGNKWTREIPLEDSTRQGVIDSLCLTLLSGGYTAKVRYPPKPEPIRDGVIRVVGGRLCVEARTEAVYKAASRLGKRVVWLDGADREDIMRFVTSYDVGVSEEAEDLLGGFHD